MFNTICNRLRKYKRIFAYILFGILTTGINYLVYLPLYNYFVLPAAVCNIIAWFTAVIFAFLTNKAFVFHAHDWSHKTIVDEAAKFFGMRALSGALETVIIFLTVDLLNFNGNIWKIITSIVVVVLNYITGKLFVFSEK